MKQPAFRTPLKVIFLFLAVYIMSCKQSNEAPPFPALENEYEQPITKKFEFSEPDTLTWITKDLSTIKPFPKTKFSWDKLPSTPIDMGQPYALKQPLTVKPFDWDSLPRTDFSLDSLPAKKLKIVIRDLGEPKIVKAANPVINPQSSRGVMNIDANFGLPGRSYSSIKDKDGMLWFGTNSGIARYDSENIEIYGPDQGLNTEQVFSMLEDRQGRFWLVGSAGSVSVIDFQAKLVYEISSSNDYGQAFGIMEDDKGRVWYANWDYGYNIIDLEQKTSRQLNIEHGLSGYANINPFQDSNGLIWLTSNRGATILDLKAGKNISLTKENGLLSDFTASFFEDHKGRMWISSGGGFQILNKDKNTMSYFTADEGLEGMSMGSDVFQDKNNNYWLGANHGVLFSYKESEGLLERYALSNNSSQFVYDVMEDSQDQIWASIAQGGLFKVDLKSGRPGNYTVENGLSDNTVWNTLVAKDGKIWICTEKGIDIYDPVQKSIKHLGPEQGLASDFTYSIMEDSKGRIWTAGNNVGVSIIDPYKESIQKILLSEEFFGERRSIRYIYEDQNNVFWLGANRGGLYTVNLEQSVFKSLVRDTTQTQNMIVSIVGDSENKIWLGSRASGIQIVDPKNNTSVKLSTEHGLLDDQILSLIQDDQQNIWSATLKGVQQIDTENREITAFTIEEGLPSNDVYALAQLNGKIYVGSSLGITILNPMDMGADKPYWKVKSIGKKQGINEPDISQNSITFDKNGSLWAGGAALELIVLDEVKEDSITYPTSITGINIMDKRRIFHDASQFYDRGTSGDTIRAGNNIITDHEAKIDSSYVTLNNIHWTAVKGPYNMPVDLSLPHKQNYLSFNFNGGDFSNPDNMVYRYILEGIDKNWSPISDKTQSENYRDLPPGNYNFKVASKGFNGVWTTATELKFNIVPPWWKTWWAYLIFIVLFLGLGLAILHYRSQWLKKENRILEERVHHRTSQLKKTIEELENTQSQLIHSEKMASLGELTAGIAHEIQNPMNFITNFSEVSIELIDEMNEEMDKGELDEAKEIAKDIAMNLDKITHHGKRASSIVKGMLEHSRNTSGQKELTDINVLADEYLRLSYHGLRAKNKSFNADFKTVLDESLPKIEVIPQDLGRVVLNLINNAFYAVTSIPDEEKDENYKPMVTVSTKKLDGQVMISIKDNGPGIPKEIKDKIFQPFFTTKPTGKGTGLGLSLAYDIITQGHGGSIELDTSPGKGTEFSIYIPF